MTYNDLTGLNVSIEAGVAIVTIDHPPLNLMDGTLVSSLRGFVYRVRNDADIQVVVFESADPEFFIAHGDMAFVTDPQALPIATNAAVAAAPDAVIPDGINITEAISEEIRSLPQITIGKIEGFARGAGNEFLMCLDMRFAAIGKSGQAQPEAPMGILPGGGGTLNLTRLVGRARTLELLLGGELVGAELAERYGLVNRAIPAAEIDAYVNTLARRIAKLRPEVVAAIKETINAVAPSIPLEAYAVENKSLYAMFVPDVMDRARKLVAAGIQTREGERRSEEILNSI